MNLGPGALSQSGSSQGLHPQGSLSDAISTGLPPATLMQGQIGNGEQVCSSKIAWPWVIAEVGYLHLWGWAQ
jgi:hypothetical protein